MPTNRIIFLSAYDPRDISKWSGTIYSIFYALDNNSDGVKVQPISGGLHILDIAARILNRLLLKFGAIFDCRFSTVFAMASGLSLTIRLLFMRKGPLLVVAGSNYVAYLNTGRDIIYISDATFRAICELYPDFQSFPNWLRFQGDRNEARSLSKSRFIIYSSRWASASARTHYQVSSDRIFELPFGPNIPDRMINEYFSPKSVDPTGEVKILFVSADWKRKNGDKVLDVCRLLVAAGFNARLILIGNVPDYVQRYSFVENKGVLQKSDPEQLIELCKAYREAHFFLMPTNADTFGIVFSESQAFGVPPITCDVGGTGSSVTNGETGLLLPVDAPADRFAEAIISYVTRPDLYDELSRRCRKWYLESANWTRWSSLILKLARYG